MSDATRRLSEELTDDELDTLVEMVKARTEGRLTRRNVVKSGGILAALGLSGGAFAGSASADASTSDSDGNVGRPSDRVDVFGDGVDANSVNAKQLGTDRHYAGAYSGSDPDGRLDSALSAAKTGDKIYLENGVYDTPRTITKEVEIVGISVGSAAEASSVATEWKIDARCSLSNINTDATGSYVINARFSAIRDSTLSQSSDVTVNADSFRYTGNFGGEVTFTSGNSGGIVDACAATSVTDSDGGNTIGDIA